MHYQRIRDLREDRELTQAALGQILHCSHERGDVDIPTEILIKPANYYDVSVAYLLGRTDNPGTNR